MFRTWHHGMLCYRQAPRKSAVLRGNQCLISHYLGGYISLGWGRLTSQKNQTVFPHPSGPSPPRNCLPWKYVSSHTTLSKGKVTSPVTKFNSVSVNGSIDWFTCHENNWRKVTQQLAIHTKNTTYIMPGYHIFKYIHIYIYYMLTHIAYWGVIWPIGRTLFKTPCHQVKKCIEKNI